MAVWTLGDGRRVEVEVHIDDEKLESHLLQRAMKNKGHKATALSGGVTLEVIGWLEARERAGKEGDH